MVPTSQIRKPCVVQSDKLVSGRAKTRALEPLADLSKEVDAESDGGGAGGYRPSPGGNDTPVHFCKDAYVVVESVPETQGRTPHDYLHFTEEEAEADRGDVSFLRSCRGSAVGPLQDSGPLCPREWVACSRMGMTSRVWAQRHFRAVPIQSGSAKQTPLYPW